MASAYRVRAVWQGFTGAPGYSNFHFNALTDTAARNAAGDAVRAFFAGLSGFFLTTWNVAVQTEVTEWDVTTGILLGAANMTVTPAVVAGTVAATPYAGGSGLCVTWKTGVIFNGRRVSGRTFVVPAVGVFESNGTLTAAAITAANTAASQLITAPSAEFSIWAKQFTKPTDGSKPVQIGGLLPAATSYDVKDMASQLRSRRI